MSNKPQFPYADEPQELIASPNALVQSFICSICMKLLDRAATVDCGHSFCYSCIRTCKASKPNCPICRKPITEIFPNLLVRSVIDSFVMRCPGKTSQESCCTWTGRVEEYRVHAETCEFIPRPVRSGQEERIPSSELTYYSNMDVRGGGTGREYVSNLGNESTEPWDKWYTGYVYSHSCSFSVNLSRAAHLSSIRLCSANDCPERDPRDWVIRGCLESTDEWVELLEVTNEHFESRWQWKTYPLRRVGAVSQVVMEITNIRNRQSGVQLGHFHLFETDCNVNDNTNADQNASSLITCVSQMHGQGNVSRVTFSDGIASVNSNITLSNDTEWCGYRVIHISDDASHVLSDEIFPIWSDIPRNNEANAQRFHDYVVNTLPMNAVVLVIVSDASCGDAGSGSAPIIAAMRCLNAHKFLEQFVHGNQLRMAYCGLLKKTMNNGNNVNGNVNGNGSGVNINLTPNQYEVVNKRHYLENGYSTPSRCELRVTAELIRNKALHG